MNKDIQAVLVTEDYRGDHGKDVRIALELKTGETVYQLIERVFDRLKRYRSGNKYRYQDHIELKLVRPAKEVKDE